MQALSTKNQSRDIALLICFLGQLGCETTNTNLSTPYPPMEDVPSFRERQRERGDEPSKSHKSRTARSPTIESKGLESSPLSTSRANDTRIESVPNPSLNGSASEILAQMERVASSAHRFYDQRITNGPGSRDSSVAIATTQDACVAAKYLRSMRQLEHAHQQKTGDTRFPLPNENAILSDMRTVRGSLHNVMVNFAYGETSGTRFEIQAFAKGELATLPAECGSSAQIARENPQTRH